MGVQTRRHFAARVQVPVAIAEEGRGRRVDRAVRMDILHAEAVRCGAVRCGAVRRGAAQCGGAARCGGGARCGARLPQDVRDEHDGELGVRWPMNWPQRVRDRVNRVALVARLAGTKVRLELG